MDTSGKILMISGGALAVVVAGLVSFLLAHQPATVAVLPPAQVGAASVQQNVVPVLIATRRIRRGTTIRPADVPRLFQVAYLPPGTVPLQTAFTNQAQLIALLRVVPRRASATIQAGQQLSAPLLSGLALPSQNTSLAARLPRGFDGETVRIPVATNADSGSIAVNDRVDVIYSRPATADGSSGGTSGGPEYTAMLIQGATVIAANPISTTYTLALPPLDAVRLAHAKDAGWALHLVVRSIFDGSAPRKAGALAGASIGQ